MIRNLRIKNFRVIENIEMSFNSNENPSLINIIVGRNGTGKSSILEALALVASAPYFTDFVGNDLLEWIVKRRGGNYVDTLIHLIKIGAGQATIEAHIDEKDVKVEIFRSIDYSKLSDQIKEQLEQLDKEASKLKEGRTTSEMIINLFKALFAMKGTTLEMPPITSPIIEEGITYFISHIDGKEKLNRLSIIANTPLVIPQKLAQIGSTSLMVLDTTLGFSFSVYVRLHDLLMRYIKVFDKVKNSLEDEEIEDFRIDSRGILNVRFKGNYIPLNMVGDGTKLLILNAFMLNLPESKIFLMEEPESHMHPAYLRKLVQLIIDSAKLGKQFFISTHSEELIDYFLVEGEGLIEEKLKAFRTYWDNGIIKLEEYDYEGIKEHHEELRLDLRGM